MPYYENCEVSLINRCGNALWEHIVHADDESRICGCFISTHNFTSFSIGIRIDKLQIRNRTNNGINGAWGNTLYQDCSFEVKIFVDGRESRPSDLLRYNPAERADSLAALIPGPVIRDEATNTNRLMQWEFQTPPHPIEAIVRPLQEATIADVNGNRLAGRLNSIQIQPPSLEGLANDMNAAHIASPTPEVGQIEVKIWRVKVTGSETRPIDTCCWEQAQSPHDEDIQHTVGVTELVDHNNNNLDVNTVHQFATYHRLDTDRPWMTFRFIYRSADVLAAVGVIPPLKEPQGTANKGSYRYVLTGRIGSEKVGAGGDRKGHTSGRIARAKNALERAVADHREQCRIVREARSTENDRRDNIRVLEHQLDIPHESHLFSDLATVEQNLWSQVTDELTQVVDRLDIEQWENVPQETPAEIEARYAPISRPLEDLDLDEYFEAEEEAQGPKASRTWSS